MRVRLSAVLILSSGAVLAQGVITTIVGTDAIVPREPRNARQALTGRIEGVAVDSAGNVYMADSAANVVLKADTQGILTVVAGNGAFSVSGDGGPATSAALAGPQALAVDRTGNLYIADTFACRVRRLAPDGIISTVAGTFCGRAAGDGGPAVRAVLGIVFNVSLDPNGNLLISDIDNDRVRRVDLATGIITTVAGGGNLVTEGAVATSAFLDAPMAAAADSSGQIFILVLRGLMRVDTSGRIFTVNRARDTFGRSVLCGNDADNPAPGANYAEGLTVTPGGDVYLTNAPYNRVCIISSRTGAITTFAGTGAPNFTGDGGPPDRAGFSRPAAVAYHSITGDLYIADAGHGRIRRVANGIVSTVAGVGGLFSQGDGGPAGVANLSQPRGVRRTPSGDLLIADTLNNRVRKVSSSGVITTLAGNGSSGYSGDGGPAVDAALNAPRNVAVDAVGNVYIADTDNHVIRRVSPAGIITTVAGSQRRGPPAGFFYRFLTSQGRSIAGSNPVTCPAGERPDFVCLGDGGPATEAMLQYPEGVAFDSAGNMYIADTWSDRIRRVDAATGRISTVVGDGFRGYFEDGVSATNASLSLPRSVAVNAAGTDIYIADWGNNRVRRVLNGIISTFAGNGRFQYLGENIPALNAQLDENDLVLDADGTLFVADTWNNRIRRIRNDIIDTVAGNGISESSGDGGPATLASLFNPFSVAVDGSGNMFIADFRQSRADTSAAAGPGSVPGAGGVIRQVVPQALAPGFNVSSTSVQFTATSGGAAAPAQRVSLTSTLPGLTFKARADTPWVSVSPAAGAIPGDIFITADPSQLQAGSYDATVTITVLGANPPTRTIAARFTVGARQPGRLGVGSPSVSFSLIQGGADGTSQLSVSNLGGGSIAFTASVPPAGCTGGSWLDVAPASGTVQANSPLALTLTARPGNLGASTYTCKLVVSSATTGESFTVPVTMALTGVVNQILLSVTGMTFLAVEQGGNPLPQNFGVLNVGQGSMNWTARATELSGGSWLTLDQTSGRVEAPFTDVSLVGVNVNARNLARGEYYGQIEVFSPNAPNSPQTISVVLTVLPLGSRPGAEVSPTGLILISQPGVNPGSQDIMVGNPTDVSLTYGSGRTFVQVDPTAADIVNWFVHLPERATVDPGARHRITIQPNFANLQAGRFYRGFLNLNFADGTSRNVTILAVAAASPAPVSSLKSGEEREAHSACRPSRLFVQATAFKEGGARVTLRQPANLQVKVFDDCQHPLTEAVGGSVIAKPTSRDSAIELRHSSNGLWTGTWTPLDGPLPSVTVRFNAHVALGAGRNLSNSDEFVTVNVAESQLPQSDPPPITTSANNSASGEGTFISPGGLVSIYGRGLAARESVVSQGPFPKALAGTQVLMGGKPLPLLYVGDGQVNAQVPFDLGTNTQQQLVVRRGNTQSVPQRVVVAVAQPAVYTQDLSGSGPGAITNAITGAVNSPDSPARIGDFVAIYCNGLGGVNPRVEEGALAPDREPLARTVNEVTVTIGGVRARVDFAGLAPGYSGLYQVNAVVPAGVTPGTDVPVVVTVAGQSSPPVTMVVR